MLPYIILFTVVGGMTFVFAEKKAINLHKKNIHYSSQKRKQPIDQETEDNILF